MLISIKEKLTRVTSESYFDFNAVIIFILVYVFEHPIYDALFKWFIADVISIGGILGWVFVVVVIVGYIWLLIQAATVAITSGIV
jgi:hypothetical protein